MFNPQLDELEWRKVYVGRAKTSSSTEIEWARTNMIGLKKGDIFMMIDPDGSPVENESGKTQFIARTDGYINSSGIPEVEIYS